MADPASGVGSWRMLTSQDVATTAGVSGEDFQIWAEMMVGPTYYATGGGPT